MAAHLEGRGHGLAPRRGRMRPSSCSGAVVAFVAFVAIVFGALEAAVPCEAPRWGGGLGGFGFRIDPRRSASVGSASVRRPGGSVCFGLVFGFGSFPGWCVCVWCASGVDSYGLRIRVCEGWFRAPGGLPSGALVMRVPLLGLSGWVPLLGISGCVPLLGLSGWVPLLGLSGYPLGRVSVWKVWVTKGTLGEGWVSFGSLSGATGWVPQGTLGVGLGVLRGGSPPPRCWGPLLGLLGSLAYETHTIPCRAESARVNVSCA